MPSYAQLSGNQATLTIPVPDDDDLVIVYKPASITPRARRAMIAMQEADFASLSEAEQQPLLDAVTNYLASIVIRWNVTNDVGQPIAPTPEGLEDMDYDAQRYFLAAILDDQRLKTAPGTGAEGAAGDVGKANGAQPSKRSSSRS